MAVFKADYCSRNAEKHRQVTSFERVNYEKMSLSAAMSQIIARAGLGIAGWPFGSVLSMSSLLRHAAFASGRFYYEDHRLTPHNRTMRSLTVAAHQWDTAGLPLAVRPSGSTTMSM